MCTEVCCTCVCLLSLLLPPSAWHPGTPWSSSLPFLLFILQALRCSTIILLALLQTKHDLSAVCLNEYSSQVVVPDVNTGDGLP